MKNILIALTLFVASSANAIDYPVDVDTTRWVFYNTATSEPHSRPMVWPKANGSKINKLPANVVPLLFVRGARPSYNALNQRLTRGAPIVDLVGETYTFTYAVENLTVDEVTQLAEEVAERNLRATIRAGIKDLNQGNGTNAQRLKRVEKGLAYLLKESLQ